MTTAATIAAQLILDASGFSAGVDKATKSADSFSKKMGAIGGQMQKIGGVMSLALTAPIVAFGVSAVKSAMESEAAIADLNATIESTGGIAGVTSQAVQDYANKMQMLTKFSDEEIISGNAMLLTFTNIGKDVFPRVSDATLDMAQKFGMDLPQASIILGKALNDPIQGVGALRRIGVQLSAQQEKQIQDFMAVNDVASAQGVILGELEKEIGGVAEAFGKTAAGQMAIFNNKLDSLKESLGKVIIPFLIKLIDLISPMVDSLASAPPWVQTLIVAFLGLVALAGPLIAFAGTIISFVGTLSTMGVTFTAIGTALATVGTFITATLIPAIVALLPVLALVAAAALLVYMVWKNWDQLKTTISQLVVIVKYTFSKMASDAKSKFVEIQNASGAMGAKIGEAIGGAIVNARNTIAEFAKGATQAWNTIGYAFKNVFNSIVSVARSVFQSIANAIAQLIGYVNRLIAAFRSIKLPAALTPGSPTPFEIGLRGISDAMGSLSNKSIPQMNAGLKTSAPAGISGLGSNKNVSIVDNRRFAGGMGADELRTALDSRINGLLGI